MIHALPATLVRLVRHRHFPILLLLLLALIPGILTFRDYGLTWDEPLFYGYADAIGYAYSIPARLSGDFQLERAFGPSPGDHANRGPAYILLARFGVYALEAVTGLPRFDLWRLVNYITFLIGAYFLYRLSLRWVSPSAALAATLLWITQPMLWGHAFINPKDPPFTTFFLAAVYLGFRMVDTLETAPRRLRTTLRTVFLPAVVLGLATAIRIVAPLAGLLVAVYALIKLRWRALRYLVPYALIAMLTTYAAWPYLWDDPVGKFLGVLQFMAANPTRLPVLFLGHIYRAYELPRRYLPLLMVLTLTEPVWPLAALGVLHAAWRLWKRRIEWPTLLLVAAWFLIPVGYILVKRPPMYDGIRHSFYLLPPLFVAVALGAHAILSWLRPRWLPLLLLLALALPALPAMTELHPYEYTYYNSFIGGTGGAFRHFETDYWLTCYKETMQLVNTRLAATGPTLFVQREAYIAAYYADPRVQVVDLQSEEKPGPGDYLLLSTRANGDRGYRDAPIVLRVGRQGADFCIVKRIPRK